jgi:hypothetical protein
MCGCSWGAIMSHGGEVLSARKQADRHHFSESLAVWVIVHGPAGRELPV